MMHYLTTIKPYFSPAITLKLIASLAILSISSNAFASGRHSVKINISSLNEFHIIDIPKNETLRLNYIGSTANGSHLFLKNKVAVSKRINKDGNERIGMPWNHILQYQISGKTISIKNGWLLDLSSSNTYNLRPGYCPAIQLINTKTVYTLPNDKNIKKSCLSGRYIRNRK